MKQKTVSKIIVLSVIIVGLIMVGVIIFLVRSDKPAQPKVDKSVQAPTPSTADESLSPLNRAKKLLAEAYTLYEQLKFIEALEKLDIIDP